MSTEESTGTEQEAPQPTLEELASKFDTPEQSPPAQRETTESTSPPKFESPEEGFSWLAKQHSDTDARVRQLVDKMTEKEQADYIAAQTRDLDTAIKTIGEQIEGMDPMYIEGALHVKYNRDPSFQKIFDNRSANPAAFQTALGVIAGELKSRSVIQNDPQLAENARALDQLQRSSRSGSTSEDKDQTAVNMSAGDFDRYWENLKMG